MEWIGPGFGQPDYWFTLDLTLTCTTCVATATAIFGGGQARWVSEVKPTGEYPL